MDEASLIDSQDHLDQLIRSIGPAQTIALDTEFLRERTFFPQLCLLQIATDSAIGCVDFLAACDFGDLLSTLGAPARTWVLHSSRQDLEILSQVGAGLPAELIDTQLAAALLGRAPQIGYAQLVEETLQVKLDKAHTRTDWRRRPIAAAALDYAINDVRYLLPLWERLEGMLEERNRRHWLTEDCAALLQTHCSSDERRWQRIKGIRGLDQQRQSVARELSDWREAQAARIDRPRRWLLSDEALIALARGLPVHPQDLAQGYELPDKFRHRHGHRLIEVIATGRAKAAQHQPLETVALSQAERKELKALSGAIRKRAETLELAPEVLATRQEITGLMRGGTTGRLVKGWRAEIIAELQP